MLKQITILIPKLLIRLYQAVLSPLKSAITGEPNCCRFYPSCSHYALESYQSHGFIKGSILTLIRLLKCQPFHAGGIDNVPNNFNLKHIFNCKNHNNHG